MKGAMKIDVDHYLVLGVPRTADAATIRAAYVDLAKKYHPDVAAGNPELAAYNFRQITEAYRVLSDPEDRARYDTEVRSVLDAERARREQAARAAATARAAKASGKTRSRQRLSAILLDKARSAARAATSRPVPAPHTFPPGSFHPPRPLSPPVGRLLHADAMARRRAAVMIGAVLLLFVGVAGYLAQRYVRTPSLEVMAASEATRRAVESLPDKPRPPPVPPMQQPSQYGVSPDRPLSAPMPGVVADRAAVPRPAPVQITDGQSVCVADDGAKFAIINRGGEPTVIYNGAAPVRASMLFADRHFVVLTGIVPTDTIIIGIRRGQENGTHVYYADPRGAIVQTVVARCEGRAY
jgi:hypothetical protein